MLYSFPANNNKLHIILSVVQIFLLATRKALQHWYVLMQMEILSLSKNLLKFLS